MTKALLHIRLTIASTVIASLFWGGSAGAGEADEICAGASLEAQVLQRNERFVQSASRYAECARGECKETSVFCTEHLATVRSKTPHIKLAVTDHEGLAIPEPVLVVDGHPTFDKTIPVDPGVHRVSASYLGRAGDAEVTLAVGESRTVPLVIDLRVERRSRPVDKLSIVAGSATVLALGTFFVTNEIARSRTTELLQTCAPYCGDSVRSELSTIDTVRTTALVSAGVLAVGTLVLFLVRPEHTETLSLRTLVR